MHLVHSQNDQFAAFPITSQAAGRTLSTAGFVPVRFVPSFFSLLFHWVAVQPASVPISIFPGQPLPFFLIPFCSLIGLEPISVKITVRGIMLCRTYDVNILIHLDRPASCLRRYNITIYLNNILFEFLNVLKNFSMVILFSINKLKSNLIVFYIFF